MKTATVCAALFAMVFSGCAGARYRVGFDSVKVPVSLSQSVLDRDGNIAGPNRQRPMGRIEGEFTGWSMCWTLVRLNRVDASEAINARVKELGGDAVVGLRCRLESGDSLLNYVLWINMLPIWPGSVKIIMDGDVVQVLP